MKKAWKTVVERFVSVSKDLTSAVAAETRGQAIAITLRQAREAGYALDWKDVKATRWPEHDGWAEVASFNGPLDPAQLPR